MLFLHSNNIHSLPNRKIMCQTSLISSSIVRLSTRTYKQRLEVATPCDYSVSRLARLNKDLDNFYELLYNQWQTITEEDYNIFGQQLNIMLKTIKELLDACKRLPQKTELCKEMKKLDMNYSAIHEVNCDIQNFKIKMPKDTEMRKLMSRASEVSQKIK